MEPAMPVARGDDANHDLIGRFGALTVITPVKWWGVPALRLSMTITRWFPSIIKLAPAKAVAFTRWSLLRSIPYNGRRQLLERPQPAYLLWETVFNGAMDPYIEQFVVMIPALIRNTWGSSYGFPNNLSVKQLRTYIETMSWPSAHSYVAYPQDSVAMILSALEIEKEHAFLVDVARTADASQFQVTYEGFLRRRKGDL
jgi:hypothetical protein